MDVKDCFATQIISKFSSSLQELSLEDVLLVKTWH